MGTNPDMDGDGTAPVIQNEVSSRFPNVTITCEHHLKNVAGVGADGRLKNVLNGQEKILAALGLVTPREQADNPGIPATIGRLWDDFFDRRPDLKKWTRSNLEQIKPRCVEFFKLRTVDKLTQGDAKDFRRWLIDQKYATAILAAGFP